MTSTAESTYAATCSVSSGDKCTCGGGCERQRVNADLPDLLGAAAAVGCTITAKDAPAQIERIEKLRRHVTAIERRRGSLVITFGHEAQRDVIDRLIEVEQGCCSFLDISREDTLDATSVVFSADDPDGESALALIARTFDPAEPHTTQIATGAASNRRNKTVLGALGVACLACFLPGLLAAGAVGSAAAAVSGEVVIAGALAVMFAVGATITLVRHRFRSRPAGCGC